MLLVNEMSNKNTTSIVLGKRHLEWLRTKSREFSFSALIRNLLDDYLNSQDPEEESNDNRIPNNL